MTSILATRTVIEIILCLFFVDQTAALTICAHPASLHSLLSGCEAPVYLILEMMKNVLTNIKGTVTKKMDRSQICFGGASFCMPKVDPPNKNWTHSCTALCAALCAAYYTSKVHARLPDCIHKELSSHGQ